MKKSVIPVKDKRSKVEEFIVMDNLMQICNFICSNYQKLQKEFSEISNILNIADSCSVAYLDINFVKMHMRGYKTSLKLEVLGEIVSRIADIEKGLENEFLQNVNFLNIVEEIFSKKDRGEIVVFVWEAKKILKHIIYEIDRINSNADEKKKVAILKGMIAYY